MVKLIRNYFTAGEVIGQIDALPNETYWIEYQSPYVTLYYGNIFLFCLDNDTQYMDDIIEQIERRTGTRIEIIPYVKRDAIRYRFKTSGFGHADFIERVKKVSITRPRERV